MTGLGGAGRWLPVIAVAAAALPVAYLVHRLRVRRGVPGRRAAAEIGMVVGTVPWLWMILTPAAADREVRLVPLVDLADVLAHGGLTAVVQVGGNLLVLAAFGFFAPWRWDVGSGLVTLVAAAAAVLVEVLQWALALGRVSSVDDVLLNAAGAGLAALLSRALAPADRVSVG